MGNMASQTVNQVAFCPPPPTYRKRDVNMWLNTDRGDRVPAFHIRNGNPITILVSHANAEDLGIVLGFWSWLSQILQVDVFAYEYCGYGWATGAPSEESMYSAARAALACLVDGFKLKPERDIVLFGKSLGSCPSCHLAAKQKFRGVVIVSGLASGARVLFPTTKLYVTDALYFHNIGRLATSKSPVQLMHGTMDEVIAFSNGTDLHAACAAYHPLPPAWIDGATHNNLESAHSEAYLRTFKAFLAHLLANPPADEPENPDGDGWWSGLKSWTSSLGSRSCLPSVPVPVVASASG
jgi:fermentation-respiration switch protein FrsA (DUF1100 family)